MSLKIRNNIESLVAHRNLSKNDHLLSKSLEKLSSGQRINTAADGPAALVISENMRAQIGGLKQAIQNNEVAVSLVQTAEGALNEMASLLIDIRQRTIAAANVGVNDEAMTEASQSEIEHALSAIDRIADTTQFGKQRLLDGSRSASGSVTGTGLELVSVSAESMESGENGYNVSITQEATRASKSSSSALTQAMIDAGETLSIQEGGRMAEYTTKTGESVKDAIKGLSSQVERSGLNVEVTGGDDGVITVAHKEYGSQHEIVLKSSSKGVLGDEADKPMVITGQDVRGSINGEKAVGHGQELSGVRGNRTTDGLKVNWTGNPELPIVEAGTSVGQVFVRGGMRFQVGANEGDTVAVEMGDMSSIQLARGVNNNSGFMSLADVDVRTALGAQDTLSIVDKAIQQVSSTRGELGAFQKNTLESNLSSLRVATENMVAAESSVRDADMAKELADFTKNQIMVQSATAQLAQANSLPQNVLRLLNT